MTYIICMYYLYVHMYRIDAKSILTYFFWHDFAGQKGHSSDTIPTVNSTPLPPKQLIWHDFVGVSLTHQHFQNHKTISALLQLC